MQPSPSFRDGLYLAYACHDGQCRKSGEPYITHPVEVTRILAELQLDRDTLIAGLLHDTVEDTALTLEEIESRYGPAVRQIVEGETKFSKLSKHTTSPGLASTATDSGSGSGSSGEFNGVPAPQPPPQDAKAQDLEQLFVAMMEEVCVCVVWGGSISSGLFSLHFFQVLLV